MNVSERRLIAVTILGFLLGAFIAWATSPNAPTLHPRLTATTTSHVRLMSDVSYAAPKSSGGGGTGGGSGSVSTPLRLKAMDWAHNQQGCWYQWGGTGPCRNGFDCSGLVYEAYLHQGVNIGRDTYEMLQNKHLVRISWNQVERGDLAFFGRGHVELMWQKRWDRTFGAHDSGQRIGSIKWGHSWHPTMYFRIRTK